MVAPKTGPFRQFLLNFSPPWVLRYLGERLTQGMVALTADLLGEYAKRAGGGPMLRDENSPQDAVTKVAASRMIERYSTDTNETHRARTVAAWTAWEYAGTETGILDQITLLGYPGTWMFVMGEDGWTGDGNTALPRRFWLVFTTEGTGILTAGSDIARSIFRVANKFRAGEERVADVTVMSAGRTWDTHPVTGLSHTWDSPGPGISSWDSSVGVTYRSL